MCGIAGFLSTGDWRGDAYVDALIGMVKSLSHRGPDDEGTWWDASAGIALGHRRLSILDLSPRGHQPMRCRCGRYCIVFNGEIYNYKDLASELSDLAVHFKSTCDTEVLLEGICHWGLEATLRKLNGMFAFAVWDTAKRTLAIARDRMGEKPLYYGLCGKGFLFGSELKALKAWPGFDCELDYGAMRLYFRHGYIPSPYSAYQNIFKLPPGTYAVVDAKSAADVRAQRYWTPPFYKAADNGIHRGDARQSDERLQDLIEDAVKLRLVADVPVGAFLSGGVDSSLVVSIAQKLSPHIRTFTVGFDNAKMDESDRARKIANYLGTNHTEIRLCAGDVLPFIESMPAIYDEPFADASQIPTLAVSRLARQSVAVSLSGDGGDELFGGYNSYQTTLNAWRRAESVPAWLRMTIGAILPRANEPSQMAANICDRYLPAGWRVWDLHERGRKLSTLMRSGRIEELFRDIVSHRQNTSAMAVEVEEPATVLTLRTEWLSEAEPLMQLRHLDMLMYLPDDILVKLDRATMAVSLEGRVPLLDHRVVEIARQLPSTRLVSSETTKLPLRRILRQYLPEDLVTGPKRGFGIPLADWLRGDLRVWAQDHLSEASLKKRGILDAGWISRIWREHLSSQYDWSGILWNVLMFQAWEASVQ